MQTFLGPNQEQVETLSSYPQWQTTAGRQAFGAGPEPMLQDLMSPLGFEVLALAFAPLRLDSTEMS